MVKLQGSTAAKARIETPVTAPVKDTPDAEAERIAAGAAIAEKGRAAKKKPSRRTKRTLAVPGKLRQEKPRPTLYLATGDDDEDLADYVVKPRTEHQLWQAHIKVLRAAVTDRKPYVSRELDAAIERLDDEAKALANRREMVAQTEFTEQERRETELTTRRAALLRGLEALDAETERLASRRAKLPELVDQRIARLSRDLQRIKRRARQLGQLKEETRRRPAKDEDEGKTPERELKPTNRNTVDLLEQRDKINHDQARAAATILAINEAIGAAGQARAVNLEGTGGGGNGAFELPAQIDELRSRKYLPWCNALRESTPMTLDVVIKIVVYGASVDALARKYEVRRSNILDHLKRGLDAFMRQRKVAADPGALTADVDTWDRK
jgi:hypothetical protein